LIKKWLIFAAFVLLIIYFGVLMMKKSLLSTTVLSCLFCAATGFASVATPNITLQGGPISPGASLAISLAPLVSGVTYNVYCPQVTDPNNAKNQAPIAISSSNIAGGPNVLINFYNGYKTANNNLQVYLPTVTTYFEVDDVIGGQANSISVINADQNDSVAVGNCLASPAK
jgi:hypothetical protein